MTASATFLVDDVRLNTTDLTGAKIERIYAKARPHYAIYRTSERVSVQYSDLGAEAADQRKKIAVLNGLRTEINGLIDGWRTSRWATFLSKAARYDGQVAAALILCLEGDQITPSTALNDVKTSVLAERTSWGRFEYLISAFIVLMVSVLVFTIIQKWIYPFSTSSQNIWLAARAGAVGAFFSIALAVSNRTVLTNMNRRDNVADASLRITIGIISAAVFVLLLGSDILSNMTIAGTQLSGSALTWPKVLIIGFVAGFLERLVPDLLSKQASPPPPAGQPPPAPGPAAGQPAPAPGPAAASLVLAPALDRLTRHLSLATALVDTIGPALPAGLLTPAVKDAVTTAKSALAAAGTGAPGAETLQRVSDATDALVTGSSIDTLIKFAAPMTGGSQSTLAVLLSVGWDLGSAGFQRWQALLLAAPVTAALIDGGTLAAAEINTALASIPDLAPAWITACARPGFIDALSGMVMSDDAVDQLWSRYGATGSTGVLFDDRDQINAGLNSLRLALLSLRLARDITDDMLQPIVASLAKAADPALRPATPLDAATLLQVAAAASKASASATVPETARAAFDALVTLVGFARQAKLDLPIALSEVLP